jgi:hypothetical protein
MKILTLLALIPAVASAANWEKSKNDQLKTELSVLVPSSQIDIKGDQSLGGRAATFKSSVANKTGLGFSYRNIGLGVGLANPQDSESHRLHGESKSTDLQFRLFGKRTYEFTFQEYTGMYLVDSYKIDPTYLAGGVELQRSDIHTRNYTFNFFWNFNDEDFSLDAVFSQNNRHIASGWGYQGILSVAHQDISGNTSLIPSSASASFGKVGYLTSIQRINIAGGGSIGGILASPKGWYAAALFGLAVGYQSYATKFQTLPDDNSTQTGGFISARLGLGYNGTKHVFGFQFINDATNSKISDGEINSLAVDGKVFYAYRWDGVDVPLFNWVSAWFD